MTLDEEFEKACEIGRTLPTQTSDVMLIAYAYYKQAKFGNNKNDPPTDSTNIVAAFKYKTWKNIHGMSKDEAKKNYIDLIKKLVANRGKDISFKNINSNS